MSDLALKIKTDTMNEFYEVKDEMRKDCFEKELIQ